MRNGWHADSCDFSAVVCAVLPHNFYISWQTHTTETSETMSRVIAEHAHIFTSMLSINIDPTGFRAKMKEMACDEYTFFM